MIPIINKAISAPPTPPPITNISFIPGVQISCLVVSFSLLDSSFLIPGAGFDVETVTEVDTNGIVDVAVANKQN
jgi:hypothetical protein